MQIIKTFSQDDAIEVTGTEEICTDVLTVPDGQTITEIKDITNLLFPVVHPTLLYKYHAIQAHPETAVTVALLKNDTYYSWDGSTWIEATEATYYTLEELRPWLPQWTGPLQVRLELPPGMVVPTLEIGYEVRAELEDWILRFGLPTKLGIDLNLTQTSYCSDGQRVSTPSLINTSKMTNIQVQPFDGLCVAASLNDCCDFVELSEEIAPGPVQLHYSLKPPIDYIDREHQINESPTITVEKLMESNRCAAASRENWILDANGELFGDVLHYHYDLLVEITVIGNAVAQSRSIARQLMAHLEDRAFLSVPPFDVEIGLKTEGTLRENDWQKQETELNSCSFTIKLYRVPFSN